MASERRLKAGALLSVGGIALLAFGAGALRESPRLAVLCGLIALPLAASLWRCLERLAALRCRPAPGQAGLPVEQQALLDNALALEARLEHTPVALFRIDGPGGEGQAAPLNANARKLVAPGRASDPAGLYRQLAAQPGDRRALIDFDTERGTERALLAVSSITLQGRAQRLAALMPVESELEAEALHAWRQLVHVLTHEIMNSLTPVASLSHTAYGLLGEFRGALPDDVGADLSTALDAIRRRADSLVDFVASYRSLSNVPAAQPERMRLDALFERVAVLVGPAWRARGGEVQFSVEPASLELRADPGQLEQALINLLKNAFEATAGNTGKAGHAWVTARLVRGARLRIEVSDDGPGVPDGLAAHIFTPFFTTKKQGGGIGLAMVRHLVHENGGTVRHARSVGRGARFVITF
ncbi:histidine kinase [Massilia sp. WF1]|uniref:sensor histidine kinase n=1 Tax=unclassified Massilia TaxID=2609279 RepID=UPI000690D417|nr:MULTISPECIES: HAMP domain-containing sensor histidine kinase [unclassified Massilia]ALK95157.1 histidine kinase [Massilia sp. WG5]KNZ67514.1 histidine kinase [Massilia sp. WF1]